jgi:hypothetical protein
MPLSLAQWKEKTCRPEAAPACKMCRSSRPEHAAARLAAFGVETWPCEQGREERAARAPAFGRGDLVRADEIFAWHCASCDQWRGDKSRLSVQCGSPGCKTCGRRADLKDGRCPEKRF